MKNLEIERKFLVLNGDFKKTAFKKIRIVQGFLSSVPERTVRVRIIGDQGQLTIKGMGNRSGTTRFEWEKEVSLEDCKHLLEICEPGMIEKERYYVGTGDHVYEVDVFQGENEGLVVAEIELGREEENFEKPSWLGAEVTGQPQFYNASLSRHPYKKWT